MTGPHRWLVLGSQGQLGTDLMHLLAGGEVLGLDRDEIDITDGAQVDDAVAAFKPTVVLNAAAFTAVDAAEADESTAAAVNALAPGLVAAVCASVGAALVHVSTDYVFAGDATSPYSEDAPTGPKSAYGRTKLAGEIAVLSKLPGAYVVRTAWVYGAHGANFVKTMARLEGQRETLSVVDDQHGSPTWSFDLARSLIALVESDAAAGVYHCTNAGSTTWHGFTQAIFEELGADPARVLPITTDEYPLPAPRPAYSVLDNRRWLAAGLPPMRPWRDALHEAFSVAGDQFRGR